MQLLHLSFVVLVVLLIGFIWIRSNKKAAPTPGITLKQDAQADQAAREISQIAAKAGMGRLLHAQHAPTPAKSFLWGIGGAVLAIGGAWAIAWFANLSKTQGMGDAASEFAKFALIVFIVGIGFALAGIRSLFGGHRHAYLYDNGIIWRRNRRIEPVSWSRMSELVRWRMGGDTPITGAVLSYILVTVDGQKLPIDKADANGDETFAAKLEEAVRRRDGRIVDGGSYFRLGKPIVPLPLQLMLLLFIGASFAVGALLHAVGVPENAVIAPAVLTVGFSVLAIELRTGRPFGSTSAAMRAPFGGPYTAIGGMLLAYSVGHVFGTLSGWLTLAIEIAVAVAVVKHFKAQVPLRR